MTTTTADRRTSGDPVQVSADTRDGGKVQVDAYTRGAPRSSRTDAAPATTRPDATTALVAAMRKLLTILNAMLRDQTPWHSA